MKRRCYLHLRVPRLLYIRLVATLLLSVQGHLLARANVPTPSACACAHAASTPCGCPMHAVAATSPDASSLPPCHRHKLAAAKPSPPPDDAPCLRAGCTVLEPELGLVAWVALPAASEVGQLPHARLATPHFAQTTRPEREPAAPPPRARG